ncbi:hypothetical protein [Streptomyces sp. NPDC000983]|uniref:hypothetical protein n=1 Tax=Streptomyces sp. NPDC000983 TaxID=3154373 RepID=UPI00331FEAE4
MSAPALPRPAAPGTLVLPASLPHPVTALVANRPEGIAVGDAAVRRAAAHKAPVLPAAELRVPGPHRADLDTARMFLTRVLPRLRDAGIGYIPVAHQVPAEGGPQQRLRAAGGVPARAARHHSPLVVAFSRGPAGVDAHTLTDASALRGGSFVHAVAPTRFTVPGPDPGSGRPVPGRGVQCVDPRPTPPAHRRPADGRGSVMDTLTALAPSWLPAAVDRTVGGMCVALAMRPRRRTTASR